MKYRNELKFICDERELAVMRTMLLKLLKPDIYSDENNEYKVRSLYLDDYNNSCYHDNESGINVRKKYRIRIYNNKSDAIKLEIKHKNNNLTYKDSCPLTMEQAEKVLNGRVLPFNREISKVYNETFMRMKLDIMRPVVIVDYKREVFTCKQGNVRVTFDKNISSSTDYKNFFNEKLRCMPILPSGKFVLEIKYDEFLPVYISTVLGVPNLQQSPFSKYYYCRNLMKNH